jgi:hypothetical protein
MARDIKNKQQTGSKLLFLSFDSSLSKNVPNQDKKKIVVELFFAKDACGDLAFLSCFS